jgi:hypothetical protein
MTYECRLFVRDLGLIWTKEELKLCQPRTLSPGERVSTRVKLQYKNSWALALVAGLQFSEDFYCQYLRSNQRSLGVFSPGLKPDRCEIDRSRAFENPLPGLKSGAGTDQAVPADEDVSRHTVSG